MTDQKQKLFRALIDVGKELATITDLDFLLPRILEISQEVFLFDNAIIRLLTSDGKALETVASFGYSQEAVEKPIYLGQGIMGKAAQFGKPYLIHNVSHTDDYIPGIEAARSELAVPLIARDRVIGVFNVENQQPDAFTASDCDALSLLAGQAAIAIDNANLYQDLCRVSREKNNLNHLNDKILSSISLGLYTIDRKMRITSWNDSMALMTHIPAEKALGRKLLETFPTLEKEGIAERLRRVLRTGEAAELRLLHRGHAGENRLQKRRLAPLKENGKTQGVVVVVEDITEFEQLLAQTIQSEKLAEVGRMSTGIAHEINNPLAVISFASQILLDNNNLTPEQQELVERIDNEVERLKGLSSELLSYSSGAQDEKRQPTDINTTMREVLTLMRYELNKKQITSGENLNPIPLLNIDKNKFKQIFINLILNAVQAMDKGGRIEISTGVCRDKSIFIQFCDNGPGIPDKLKQRIFDPFFTSRKDGQGTGLGLYLCRKIISEYDGSLTVTDVPDGGSCFEIKMTADNTM
ncbi:ATP-binding protein [uncultured Desulfuromusa sp.]|uniref:ATP-binding protein n=1 Tax=uncultured Desulfuromusa sp. TaxID=219183 RepID=UPI002AA64A3A|nr:ATP-binding protein [uncultured Desulfuromusa sp.]